MLYHKINHSIIRNFYILIILLAPAGCGSKFMFTYSDHSSENYLEDQRQKTPWQPDTAEMELKKTTREDNLIKNRLTSRVKEVVNGSTLLLENGEIGMLLFVIS